MYSYGLAVVSVILKYAAVAIAAQTLQTEALVNLETESAQNLETG